MSSPQAFSNQCSSKRTHATRLHLNTGVLSSPFNSLFYLLVLSVALPLQLPSVSVLFLLLLYPSSVISLPPFSFSGDPRAASSSSPNNTCLVTHNYLPDYLIWGFFFFFLCSECFSRLPNPIPSRSNTLPVYSFPRNARSWLPDLGVSTSWLAAHTWTRWSAASSAGRTGKWAGW